MSEDTPKLGRGRRRPPSDLAGWKGDETPLTTNYRMYSGIARTPRTVSARDLLDKVYEVGGNIGAVAVHYGVGRATIMSWLRKDKNLKALDDIKESWVDAAEATIHSAIVQGDTTAAIFKLKTVGKNRGYYEKTETALEGKITVTLEGGGTNE